LYFISVSGAFLGTSLPPTPNWSRFDLFIDVYSMASKKMNDGSRVEYLKNSNMLQSKPK
jgi:hypothetical protein